MINTKQIFYLILLTSLISCSTGKKSGQVDYYTEDQINVRDSIEIVKDLSFSFEIEVVQYNNPSYKFINDDIIREICLVFSNDCNKVDLELSEENISKIALKYSEILKEDYGSEPDEYKPFEIYHSFNCKEVYTKEHLIILEKNLSSYTGGAHGNYNLQYTLYDSKLGTLIKIHDIFDSQKLNDIGRENFLVSKGLAKASPIKDSGFWFENDKFYLPENFTIDNKNLTFIYNPYEIASYAEGIIELEIPLDKLKNIIKEEYKFIIN